MVDHPKTGFSAKLAKNIHDTQELRDTIHGAVNGVLVRIDQITETAKTNGENIAKMEASQNLMASLLDDNKRLVQELKLLQGLVQKISQQTDHSAEKLLDLTKRGMEQNILIHGMDDEFEEKDRKARQPMFSAKERPKHAVLQFLKTEMNVDISVEDIWKAHRTGAFKPGKVRPMVVKLSYSAKDLIMDHIGSLKDKANPITKQKYFIAEQIPEGITETRKQVSNRVKVLKDQDAGKSDDQKKKIQVVNNNILVNGQIDKPVIAPPQPSQLFVDGFTQARIDQLQEKIVETPPQTHKNSVFSAIALKIHNLQQLQDAYIAVAQRYPSADHIMMGYAYKEEGKLHTGFCDDREYGAGHRIKNTIFELKAKNTAVFVLRTFGGIHMGFDRFAVITGVASEAINLLPK